MTRNTKVIVFNKPFFKFTFISYLIGMIVTIGVMHFFRAAQPALLYLVPGCIGGSLLCALLLNEVKDLIFFEEVDETAEKNKNKKNKNKKNKKPRRSRLNN